MKWLTMNNRIRTVLGLSVLVVCAFSCFLAGLWSQGASLEFESVGDWTTTAQRRQAEAPEVRRPVAISSASDNGSPAPIQKTSFIRGRVLMADGSTIAIGATVRLQGYGVGINGLVQEALDAHGAELQGESEEIRTVMIHRTTQVGEDGVFEWRGVEGGSYGIHVELKRPGLTALSMLSLIAGDGEESAESRVHDLGDILLGSIATIDGDGIRVDQPTDVIAGSVRVLDETEDRVGSQLQQTALSCCEILVLSPTGMRGRIGCHPDERGAWRIEGLSPRGEGVFQVWSEMRTGSGPTEQVRAVHAFHKARSERLAAAIDDEERTAILSEPLPTAGRDRSPLYPYRTQWRTTAPFVVPGDRHPYQLGVDLSLVLQDPTVYYGIVDVDVRSHGGHEEGKPHGMLVTMEDGTPLVVPLPMLTDGRASFSLVGLGPIGEAPVPCWLEVYGMECHIRMRLSAKFDQVSVDEKSGRQVVAMQCLPGGPDGVFDWWEGSNLSGRLVDGEGVPQAGVLLGLCRPRPQFGASDDSPPPLSRTAITDDRGVFRFHQVQLQGVIVISAPIGLPLGLQLQNRAGERCEWLRIEVPFQDGDIQLPRPICLGGRRLEGG